jgi:predicted ester cyclase
MSATEINKAAFRELLEVEISGARFELTERLVHPDFFDHTNPPGLQHGLEGHRGIVTLFHSAFPDGQWVVEDLIAEGDRVVARTTFRGTQTGDFFGLPATGKRVEMTGVHIGRFVDGKIIEHWGSNDDLGMMRQLGTIPG